MVLEDLRGAIEASDWPRALSLALVAWRRDRVPALADVIDLVSARIRPILPRQKRNTHAWWIEHAQSYAEAHVSGLVATVENQRQAPAGIESVAARHATSAFVRRLAGLTDRGLRAYSSNAAWIDRLAYILDWHDDPRWAPVLARWLRPPRVPFGMSAGELIYGAIAHRLAELGDARVLPLLADCTDVDATIAALRARPPTAPVLAQEIAAIHDLVAPSASPQRDPGVEAALWADVARTPDDVAPRLVLADYLVQHGDPRGELIVLQNTATAHAVTLANKLVATHSKRWLGEVAQLCTRRGTVWRHGMLDEIRIGTLETPASAFAAVPGHRELACVRTVVPAQLGTERLAEVIDALPNITHLVIDSVELASELARRRSRWAFRIIELGTRDPAGTSMRNVIAPILDILAPIAPGVVEVVVSPQYARAAPRPEILDPLARIREWFPALQRLRIPQRELDGHFVLRELGFATGVP